MCRIIAIIMIVSSLLDCSSLYSSQIGSDTAVTEFTAQQVLTNGGRVASFAWLKAGFELQNFNTTATFDSYFPVSGLIDLNAGNLLLNTDLFFSNLSSFATVGNIIGQGHAIDLAPTMTYLPSLLGISTGAGLTLLDSAANPGAVLCSEWYLDNSSIFAGNAAAGTANQSYYYSFDGANLTVGADTTQGAQVNAAAWHPTKPYLAVATNNSTGNELTVYDVDTAAPQDSTVLSTFNYNGNATALAYHPDGNWLVMGGTLATQQLVIFPISGTGALGSGVTYNAGDPVSAQAVAWSSDGLHLAVGLTAGTTALQVYNFNTGTGVLTLNGSVNLDPTTAVTWYPFDPTLLAVGTTANPTIRLYRYKTSGGTFTQVSTISTGVQVNQLEWDPTGVWFIAAQNTPDTLSLYEYSVTASTFSSVQNITGLGTGNSAQWSPVGDYITLGSSNDNLYVYGFTAPESNACVIFSNVTMNLNNDLYLNNLCITFTGSCTINGNGNTMTILPTSTVNIGVHSQLRLSNITIAGINNQNFGTIDNTGSCIFENVNFYMSDSYNWNTGYFVVEDMFRIQGPGQTFIYSTNLVSTVSSFSTLMMDYKTTFSYAPTPNSNSLINFMDNTGIFKLFNATLYASSAGLAFTQGIFMVDGSSSILNTASSASQGVSFGDGVNVGNDTMINILPAAVLNLLSGYLVYQNV